MSIYLLFYAWRRDSCVHVSSVLCTEKLSSLIEKRFGRGTERRPIFFLGRNGPSISNLLFADEVTFFRNATIDQARAMVLSLGLLHYFLGTNPMYSM